jgi:ribosomal protein S18 acetylase RimI-like enzyme
MLMRKTTYADIDAVMKIIHTAQHSLYDSGVNQWQNNYPNEKVITADIDKGSAYVLTDRDEVIATAAVSFDGEPCYNIIYEGKWLTDDSYAVIHRIAVSGNHRREGIGSEFISEIRKMCIKRGIYSIKIDTHRDNLPMRDMLRKEGFKYCGIIYLGDGFENSGETRLAYELIIDK